VWPQLVHQALGRHHPIRRQEEEGKDGPFPAPAHPDGTAGGVEDLQRTENPELHHRRPPFVPLDRRFRWRA
jgi:hypothetical protein